MERRTLAAALGALASVAAASRPASAAEAPAEQSRAVAERFAAALGAHDMDAFAALFDDGYVNHQVSAAAPPPPAGKSAKQATVEFFAARLRGMPDLSVTTEAVVPAPGLFAASFAYAGTHSGPYLGVPPTGRPLRFTSCDIFRLQDGRIVEHWGMGDIAGQLAQMKG